MPTAETVPRLDDAGIGMETGAERTGRLGQDIFVCGLWSETVGVAITAVHHETNVVVAGESLGGLHVGGIDQGRVFQGLVARIVGQIPQRTGEEAGGPEVDAAFRHFAVLAHRVGHHGLAVLALRGGLHHQGVLLCSKRHVVFDKRLLLGHILCACRKGAGQAEKHQFEFVLHCVLGFCVVWLEKHYFLLMVTRRGCCMAVISCRITCCHTVKSGTS